MIFFELDVHSIFILLGDKCNFNCKYCIQGKDNTISSTYLPKTININIYSFIKKICMTQKTRPSIIFYGGEPLLYLDKIEEIINKTKHLNLSYSIITNGSLINDEIIDFFNKYKINIIISWDGKRTLDTRNIDVFNEPKNKELLFKLNSLTISSVLSAKNYPLEICNDIQDLADEYKFYNKNGKFYANFEEIVDNNLLDRELLEIDFQKVKNDVEIIVNECSNYLKNYFNNSIIISKSNGKTYIKTIFLEKYLGYIRKFKEDPNNYKIIGGCRDGLQRLDMDLAGNLYFCHDSRKPLGNIDKLDLIDYISNYFKHDNTKELYNTLCHACDYYSLCLSGCKLLSLEARKNYTCKFKEAIGTPILNYLNKI